MEVEKPQCETLFWHLPTGTEEKHESPPQNSQSQSLDLNSGPSKHKAEMPPT